MFIACNPLGLVPFLWKACCGRVSDNELVRSSGYIQLKYHQPGHQLHADHCFTLAGAYSTELIISSFTKGKKNSCRWKWWKHLERSALCEFIETAIGLMKNQCTILRGSLPIIRIKSFSDGSRKLWIVFCCQINKYVRPSLILVRERMIYLEHYEIKIRLF